MDRITAMDAAAQSADITADNIAQLKALFPEMITEGAEGAAINVDVLKQLVGDATVTDAEEKYGLNWHGKRRARQIALTPSTGTLRPCPEDSVDWDTTQNLMIEGDNLEVLKLLQKSYAGKVKLIYIDPPYNTGNDFVYPDNFQDSIRNYKELTGQAEGGRSMTSNTEASGRFHTDWLNMMYPRLKLARNLLADDGIIAISIDDAELFQLGKLLDEVFGSESKLACAPWLSEASGGKEKTGLRTGHEYLQIYFKTSSTSVSQEERSAGELNQSDAKGRYRKGRELMKWGGTSLRKDRPKQFYPLRTPGGEEVLPHRNDGKEGHWRWGKNNSGIEEALKEPEFFHWERRPFDDSVSVNGNSERWVPYEKIRDVKKAIGWGTWLDKYGTNADGTRELKELFGSKPFDTPKPTQLIKWFLSLHADDDAVVLDFFAGSASTAHAVMQINAEDEGSRRFIVVQLPEKCDDQSDAYKYGFKTIAELTKERLRRAGAKVRTDNSLFSGDTGFRVYKLDHSNIRAWQASGDLEKDLLDSVDHIVPGRSEQDVLTELLLKLGLDLCVPIERRTIAGKAVHAIGGGVLLACLDTRVAVADAEPLALGIAEWHKALAPAGDTTCVFRDSAFENDVAKTNLAAILDQHGISHVRSL